MESTVSFDDAYSRLTSSDLHLSSLEEIIPLLGANHPTHFGQMDVGGLELQQIPEELAGFVRFVASNSPRRRVRYLEVGVGSCGTMIFLNETLRRHGFDVELYGVDSLLYYDMKILENQKDRIDWVSRNLGANVHIGDTSDADFARFMSGKTFDVILIDSGHSYDGVMREFLLCLPHLADDGMIAFHDMASAECPEVVAAFAKIGDYFERVDKIVHSQKCGIGVCRGLKRPLGVDDFFNFMFWDAQAHALAPELPALHGQLKIANQNIEQLTTANRQLIEANAALERAHTALSEENKELGNQVGDLERQAENEVRKAKALEAELVTVRAGLADAEHSRRLLAEECGTLQSALSAETRRRKVLRLELDSYINRWNSPTEKFVRSVLSAFKLRKKAAKGGMRNGFCYHIDRLKLQRKRGRPAEIRAAGWAVDLEGGEAALVRIRLRGKDYQPQRVHREDVKSSFSQVCVLPAHTGFEAKLEAPTGFCRVKAELRLHDGSWMRIYKRLIFVPPRLDHLLFGAGAAQSSSYAHWIKAQRKRFQEERSELEKHASLMLYQPTFAIVIDGNEQDVRRTVASLENQIYKNWHRSAAADAVGSSNADFVVFLQAGDVLSADALYEFASALNAFPDADMIYGDEDEINAKGKRERPFFKPDWSPDYLETFNYIGYPACFRRTAAERCLGGVGYYDFVLRFTEITQNVHHVRKVLCSRNRPEPAARLSDTEVDRRALQGRLERTGRRGDVVAGRDSPGYFNVTAEVADRPLVSIIIPTAGKVITYGDRVIDLLHNCVTQIREKSTYNNFDFVLVDNGDLPKARIAELEKYRCKFITYRDPVFNVAKKLNLGATIAEGEMFIILNDDIEIVSPDWIERLLEHFEKPHVGVVGAKLLYPDRTIQHAGVVHNFGNPDHVRRAFAHDDLGYFFSTCGARNYIGVTGACMMTRRDVYLRVGGYSEALAISYNDIDYCQKVRELGLTVVYAPRAELIHFESQSRVPCLDMAEWEYYHRRWAPKLVSDPFYNERNLNTAPPTFAPHANPRGL